MGLQHAQERNPVWERVNGSDKVSPGLQPLLEGCSAWGQHRRNTKRMGILTSSTTKKKSWFLYQGRGFFWTDQYSPALTFLYVWRWALHYSCKFYETRYLINYTKPGESGSSLQSSNFPAKEQEQFTVKSIGTCLLSQVCGFWLLCLHSDACTCLTGCSCTDHTSVGWLTHLFLQGWDLH